MMNGIFLLRYAKGILVNDASHTLRAARAINSNPTCRMHKHTHTQTRIYVYICVYICTIIRTVTNVFFKGSCKSCTVIMSPILNHQKC